MERNIGKVISVDSFRIFIRLDDDLKSLYKSGYEDIYEVARINSYVIIPIGADKIVAMVTSVRAIDETELGKNKEAIFLTKSSRYLVATMIGTIENGGKYIQGVYNYPILDNPVWYVTRQDLDSIFDQRDKNVLNFEEDYYLPIGTSPSFSDFDYLFEPTSGTQAPVFKRALGLAKNQTEIKDKPILDKFVEKGILNIIENSPDEIKKRKCVQSYGNWLYNKDNEIIGLAESIATNSDTILSNFQILLKELGGEISMKKTSEIINNLSANYLEYINRQNKEQIAIEKNIDLPIWFNFQELIARFFDEAINEQENTGNRLREFVSTLRLRLQSYLNDERISQPLLLSQTEEIHNALAKFIAFILGDFCKVYNTEDCDLFSEFYKKQLNKVGHEKLSTDCSSQITIIDMSLLPYEVLETITGLIGRLILEFVSRFPENDRGKLPMVIALEEAQNYIPEKNRGDKESIAKKVFERIAREGRKYGISLLVSSQRPSELSRTVLSQCNSFIVHRLQNPEDQKYVRQLVSAANEDILQQLPILPQQHVIIMGDAVRTPVQARMNTANPRPNSNNPKFIENWTKTVSKDFPRYQEIADAWEKGEKYSPEV